MDDLQEEVESFVSQLGFDKLKNFRVDADGGKSKEKPSKPSRKRNTGARKDVADNGAPKEKPSKRSRKRNTDSPNERTSKVERPAAGAGVNQKGAEAGVSRSGRAGGAAAAESSDRAADGSAAAVQVDHVSSSTPTDIDSYDKWYHFSVTDSEAVPAVQQGTAASLLQEATAALNQAVKAFKADDGGQGSWTQTVLTSGTVSDKLAVRQKLLASRPQLALHLLDDTVRMVAAKGRGHAMQAMHMLANVFEKHLLPPDRKLKPFLQQPLGALQHITNGDPATRRRQLIFWLLEDRLKTAYAEFVGRVRDMAHDTLEKTRKHGVSTLSQLLAAHPENEQTLLESLVNKLGDEKKSVACLAVRRLSAVLRSHPAMRTVVVKEVERLLFRQNVGKRVQLHGIIFLSQVQFSDEGDEPLAQRIVRIYIGFFRSCVKQAELDARLMRALLTGLSACVVRARLLQEQLQQYVHPLHHIAQLANFGVATQALLLMFRLTTAVTGQTEPTDRYYSCLYRKLVHPGLATSQKVADFLNLVYRSVRIDPCEVRARAFIKRLLQCCLHQTAALSCSVLLLVSELFRRRPELARLSGQPAADSGWTGDQDSDGEETPRDVPLPEKPEKEETAAAAEPAPVPGWQFVSAARPSSSRRRQYDPLYREPRWCRAERAALHELLPLTRHLHPTLALFADQLTAGRPPAYTGNPLHDFQLMHFLNRFCYRNPKCSGGGSAAEAARRLPVTAPGYARLSHSQVPHDELFFHRYFTWRAEQQGLADSRPARHLTDASGDVTDEAFDAFLDGFFVKQAAGGGGVDFLAEMADGSEEPQQPEGWAGSGDDDMELDGGGLSEDESQPSDLDDSLGDDSDGEQDGFSAKKFKSSPMAEKRKAGFSGFSAKKFKSSPMAGKRKAGKGGDVSELFVSADQFSELLEDGAKTSQQADTANNTNRHQLQWEEAGSSKRRRQTTRPDRRSRHRRRPRYK